MLKIFGQSRRGDTGSTGVPLSYSLDHLQVSPAAVVKHALELGIDDNTLIVVSPAAVELVASSIAGTVISIDELESTSLPGRYTHLIWGTECIDPGARASRTFIEAGLKVSPIAVFGPARVWHHNPLIGSVLRMEYALQQIEGIEKFGYGIGADHGNLCQLLDATRDLPGSVVELGTYMGSSACVMLRYMSEARIVKDAYFVDTFTGFDYDEARYSSDRSWFGTHATDGASAVHRRLLSRAAKAHNVHVLVRNVCQEGALDGIQGTICLANVDLDLFEAVFAGITAVWPRMQPGGIVVVEDPGHTPALLGAKAALEKALTTIAPAPSLVLQMESGQYILQVPMQ